MKLVFTDLDGTLLDHNTYSYKDALPGLSILKEMGILLVLVSSKTLPEMKLLHEELGLTSPIVFENGAGIAFYKDNNYIVELTGAGSDELLKKFSLVKEILKVPLKTISEMGISEIAEMTGLSLKQAEYSKMREASCPFIYLEDLDIDLDFLTKINYRLKDHRLMVTKGGRFLHFSSIDANKGNAAGKVKGYFHANHKNESILTAGLGDSENDIPLLKGVDFPYLVRKHDRSHIKTGISNVIITRGIGPAGFSEAMKHFAGV